MTHTTTRTTSRTAARTSARPATQHATDLLSPARLPDRVLTETELVGLARDIVAEPSLWRQHLRFSDEHRHYVSLYRDTNVEAWLICWTPVSDTGWHDHDTSAGAVAVARGAVIEHALTLGGPELERVAARGAAYSFGPDHIHRMTGRDAESATVHVYSPPLWRMGQYTISAEGVLRRQSVSYAEELRPLGPETWVRPTDDKFGAGGWARSVSAGRTHPN